MTIREADAFYKLVCFDAAYRVKMAGALRQAGLPESKALLTRSLSAPSSIPCLGDVLC